MNLLTKQINQQTEITNFMVTKEEKGDTLGVWDQYIYTLLYIKQMTNKDFLSSTGNYTQYFIITHKEKESDIYFYIYVCMCIYTHTYN